MVSVIIPAHNEASVIGRTLAELTRGTADDCPEIIVVCNGCSDETAIVARRYGPWVRVVETAVAGKIAALNIGDREATSFPRVYLDADVLLSRPALDALAARLDKGDVLAAAPTPRFVSRDCSWPVRAFYAINGMLPSAREGIGGSGVYAMSEAGRARFDDFPDVVADDGFVRILFSPDERATLAQAECAVFAPRTLSNLIAIKTRSHLGSYELARRFPGLWGNRGEPNNRALLSLFLRPSLWPRLAVYCLVKIEARRRARRRLQKLAAGQLAWARDETSRTVRSEPAAGPRSQPC
jgi:glycosyltransferase involved in cell wall biosynthesis